MARIMIDLDGVCYNYVDAFKSCVREQRGDHQTVLADPTCWTFYKEDAGWNMTTPEFLESMRRAIRKQNLFSRGAAYAGAADALHTLAARGHTLVAVSSRKYGRDTEAAAYKQTTWWCDWMKLPFSEIILTSSDDKKSEVCKAYQLNIAIEDSLDQQKEIWQAGTACWLMDRPWNQEGPEFWRVRGWADLLKAMEGM